jgi:hypothetical protein
MAFLLGPYSFENICLDIFGTFQQFFLLNFVRVIFEQRFKYHNHGRVKRTALGL